MMNAEFPYENVSTIEEKRTIRGMRSSRSRKESVQVGDRIVYDPFDPSGIAQSWRERAGLPATIVKVEWHGKVLVEFDHDPGRYKHPAWSNFYLSDKAVGKVSWEV